MEDAGIERIADAIYRGYGSDSHYLFGIPPEHEKAVRKIIELAITKYKEVYTKVLQDLNNEECSFYKDGKCTKTYEEVKKMSLSRCYTCIYNPAKMRFNNE